MSISIAQPPPVPFPFEDSYTGIPNLNMKLGKVKTHRTYYRFGNASERVLHTEHNYNKKGFIDKEMSSLRG